MNGERTRKHEHFLKGTVFCGTCGARLGIHLTKSRSGELYPYFVCYGRQRDPSSCAQKAVLIEEVEEQIATHYRKIQLDLEFRQVVEKMLVEDLRSARRDSKDKSDGLQREREKLERQRGKLMQTHYEGAIPVDLLKQEQDRIADAQGRINIKLDASSSNFDEVEDNLKKALDLTVDCTLAYRTAPDHIKKQFNWVFFRRILVHADSTITPELAPPFDTLLGPGLRSACHQEDAESVQDAEKPTLSSGLLTEAGLNRRARRLLASLLAHGSVKRLLVEPRGIEPLTSWLPAMRSPS